jgi:hypothetical protein
VPNHRDQGRFVGDHCGGDDHAHVVLRISLLAASFVHPADLDDFLMRKRYVLAREERGLVLTPLDAVKTENETAGNDRD